MLLAILLIVVNFLITPKVAFATNPPSQISPTNNSQVSSSKLTWETPTYSLYSTNPYRVQVDDNSDFSSTYRDYNTKNTYYTPVLTAGIWFWRIKAKDSNGIWSDWSNTWAFTLATTSPAVAPTTTPASTPSPTSNPTLPPTSQSTSSFSILNTPSQINSDQSFSVSINLSLSSSPNTSLYLKGAFKKADSSNYFGQTKISDSWVKNSSSYTNQYKIITDSSGNWSGSFEVKPDIDDSGFAGSGDYFFKVARYTDSGSGPSWSNEISVNIIVLQPSSEQDTDTLAQKNISSVNSVPKNTPSTSSPQATSPSPHLVTKIASIAGAKIIASQSATSSTQITIKNQKQISLLVWIGIILIIAGMSFLGYIYLKRR